jgi:hypothetical protein
LVLSVLLAWVVCLAGAVVLTGYLAVTGIRRLRGESPPRPPGTVRGLLVFAVLMAAAAVALAGIVLRGETPGSASSALAWAALPLWTAFVSALTAMVLARPSTPAPTAR